MLLVTLKEFSFYCTKKCKERGVGNGRAGRRGKGQRGKGTVVVLKDSGRGVDVVLIDGGELGPRRVRWGRGRHLKID